MEDSFKTRIESGHKIEVGPTYFVDNKEVSGPKGYIADTAFISKIYQDTDTMIQTCELTYLLEEKFHTVQIKPEDITPNKINNLNKFGVVFDPFYSKEFSRYLSFQKNSIKVTKVVNQAGWVVKNENLSYVTVDSLELSYGGALAIQTKGNFDDWLTGVNEHVLDNVELELVMAIALSSVLIGFDSICLGKDIGSGLVSLYGDSSSGKTSSAIFALSCFGEPISQKKGSLMKSFSSTKNSMIKSLASLNGVMLCFDDLSSASTTDVSDLIYNIGNGKEKDRLTETSMMQEGASFITQVLVTGEESLQQYTKKNGGIGVRYIEFDGLQFTKSASHSEKIKQIFSANYGFAAPKFAEYLVSLEEPVLSEAFDEIVESFKAQFPNSNGKVQRFIKRISAIFLTAQLIEGCFNISLQQELIYNLLIENIANQALLLDYAATTLDLFLSWITKKQNHFVIDENIPKNNGDVLGEIDTTDGYIKMTKEVFELVIDDLGLPSSISILKDWKKQELIKSETDRLFWRDSNKRQYLWLNQIIDVVENEREEK